MASSPQLKIRGFDHVTMVVADLQKTADFYGNLLGLQAIDRPAFDFDGSWFQTGNVQLHFIQQHDASGSSVGDLPLGERSSRSHHIAFYVEEWEQTLAYLNANSVAIVAGPKTRPDGALQIYIRDPDGHLIELCCEQNG